MSKGYVPTEMSVSRLVDWGQITDLSSGFKLSGAVPFSVFIRPKVESSASSIVIQAMPYQGDSFTPTPVILETWMENVISELAPDAVDLSAYDVWWGAGKKSREE